MGVRLIEIPQPPAPQLATPSCKLTAKITSVPEVAS